MGTASPRDDSAFASATSLAAEFRRRHGADPESIWFSPGRVNTMGAHLDYNGGPVMPCAIDRGTLVALRRRADGRATIASTSFEGELSFEVRAPPPRAGRWSDYPLGVLHALLARLRSEGREPSGVDLLYGGDLPIGAGLSSSASICVGTARALSEAFELESSDLQVVEAALLAERGFVGVRCGIMDPYAVAMARPGALLWLDCKDASWTSVPLDLESVSIAVLDTHVRRELAQVAFNERVQQCSAAFEVLRTLQPAATCLRDIERATLERARPLLEPPLASRAAHVVEEVARTFEARDALLAGDVAGFGARMTAAHASLRANFEVSVRELDLLVECATSVPGVHGARLTGAGFGGCVVALLARGAEQELREACGAPFAGLHGWRPSIEVYRPGGGPRRLAR